MNKDKDFPCNPSGNCWCKEEEWIFPMPKSKDGKCYSPEELNKLKEEYNKIMTYKKYIKEYEDFPIDGINYLDLNPIYQNSTLRDKLISDCLEKVVDMIPPTFDYIGVVESRGFLIGSILAHLLDKGIVLLRSKKDRLPGKTHTVKHKLEYGESIVQVQEGNGKVLVFDDVLATGGTAEASIECLTKAGYTPVGALFLVELKFLKPKLTIPHRSVINYEEK